MHLYKKGVYLSIILFFSLSGRVYTQDSIRINEFMAINNNTITDEDTSYSDWIEIYNYSTSPVNMSGWYLTDDITDPKKWAFPNITIESYEYLIIFASGKNRLLAKDSLHTNFKLSGSGEYLALIKPDGSTVVSDFNPAFPEQYSDVSYGYIDNTYQYLNEPTPGSKNINSEYIVPPKFSVQHGYYYDAFNLEISSNQTGIDIYYTTDASIPTDSTGTLFSGAINITGTTIIRAIATKSGTGSSETVSSSYIFPEQVIHQSNNQPGYPETWLSPIHSTDDYFEIPGNYDMKQNFVNREDVSPVIVKSLESLPVVSVVTDIDHLFSKSWDPDSGGIYMYNGEPDGPTRLLQYHHGRGWERPASVEYFNPDETDGKINFQSNCVLKIHGGATRTRAKTEKHSFKIGFKSEYGPSKLNEQIFGDDSPEQYDWLILRGGFAPRLGLQIRDPWTKRSFLEMGQPGVRSKFVHLYLNGLYWGMYNLSERLDENFMRDHLGGSSEDYDILKDYYEIEHGDTVAWDKLVAMAGDNISDNANYQNLLGNNADGTPNPSAGKMINPDNLINYILLNMFAGNTDWDQHNWVAARRKTNSEGFHFFVWDAEYVFRGDIVSDIVSGGYYNRPTGIFSDLLQNETFKNLFISHVNKHFFEDGALTPKPSLERYENWLDEIDTALISDQARWVYDSTDIWNKSYHEFIYTYFPPRTEKVFAQFISYDLYPDIGFPEFSTYTKYLPADSSISITGPKGATILYTLDGTDPGYFTPLTSSSIKVYDGTPITFTADTLTIWARAKKDTLWSRLMKRDYFVENDDTPISNYKEDNDRILYIYPNPVQDFTHIVFSLSKPAEINIKIYSIPGKEIAFVTNDYLPSGENVVLWNAEHVSSGVYICILENLTNNTNTRITVIKK